MILEANALVRSGLIYSTVIIEGKARKISKEDKKDVTKFCNQFTDYGIALEKKPCYLQARYIITEAYYSILVKPLDEKKREISGCWLRLGSYLDRLGLTKKIKDVGGNISKKQFFETLALEDDE